MATVKMTKSECLSQIEAKKYRNTSISEVMTQLTELIFDEIREKKYTEFKSLMLTFENCAKNDFANAELSHLAKQLTDFINTLPFKNDNAKAAILLIVEKAMPTFESMKQLGKNAWHTVVLMLNSMYLIDSEQFVKILYFTPKVQSVRQMVADNVEFSESVETETTVISDDSEGVSESVESGCDSCPKTIQANQLPVGRGKPKSAKA